LRGFYLDEHIPLTVASTVFSAGVRAVTAHECEMLERDDGDHLRFASARGLCVVTRNRDDFLSLATLGWERREPHAGILIVPSTFGHRELGALADALVAFAQEHPEDLWEYGVWWLQKQTEGS